MSGAVWAKRSTSSGSESDPVTTRGDSDCTGSDSGCDWERPARNASCLEVKMRQGPCISADAGSSTGGTCEETARGVLGLAGHRALWSPALGHLRAYVALHEEACEGVVAAIQLCAVTVVALREPVLLWKMQLRCERESGGLHAMQSQCAGLGGAKACVL